jgi:hypothetical protein
MIKSFHVRQYMQVLAESFSSDFATWLLGEPIALTELSPKELSPHC